MDGMAKKNVHNVWIVLSITLKRQMIYVLIIKRLLVFLCAFSELNESEPPSLQSILREGRSSHELRGLEYMWLKLFK